MLALLTAIKTIIERYIVGKVSLLTNAVKGDTVIEVASARRFNIGDLIAVYSKPAVDQSSLADIRTIVQVPDWQIIVIDKPLSQSFPKATSGIEKTWNRQFIDGVYIGNPPVLPAYPAITVEMIAKENEPLTLESTTEDYTIAITVFSDASDFQGQYGLMLKLAQEIENSLFRSLYPLVEPFDSAPLAEPVDVADRTIRLAETINAEFPLQPNQDIFIESTDRLSHLRVCKNVGSLLYELTSIAYGPFNVGDLVIRPRRHFYMTFPERIDFADIDSKDGPLKAARLTYIAREERNRFRGGFRDPLTF